MIEQERELPVAIRDGTSLRSVGGFFERMAEVLADEKVKMFFSDYFSTWTDAQSALMMMQTYIVIDQGYFEHTGKRLESNQIATVVKSVIMDRNLRPLLVEAMKEFMSGQQGKFISAFQKICPPSSFTLIE